MITKRARYTAIATAGVVATVAFGLTRAMSEGDGTTSVAQGNGGVLAGVLKPDVTCPTEMFSEFELPIGPDYPEDRRTVPELAEEYIEEFGAPLAQEAGKKPYVYGPEFLSALDGTKRVNVGIPSATGNFVQVLQYASSPQGWQIVFSRMCSKATAKGVGME